MTPLRTRVCAVGLLATTATGQTAWTHRDVHPRLNGPVVSDFVHGRLVQAGWEPLNPTTNVDGPQSWQWDGNAWSRVAGQNRNATFGFAMCAGPGGGIIAFGGLGLLANELDETWVLNGNGWQRLQPAVSPSPRFRPAMCFDLVSRRVVLFGGSNTTSATRFPSETWEWDGATWIQTTRFGPTGRLGHAMAYDITNSEVLLFGGADTNGQRNDTWLYRAGAWRAAQPMASPSARAGHCMAFDLFRGRTVLFGGGDLGTSSVGGAISGVQSDTWEWDGQNWLRMVTVGAPLPRADAGMTFDFQRQRVVLVGGSNFQVKHGDVWSWDGTRWLQLDRPNAPDVDLSAMPLMAYDPVLSRSILVMSAETWTWNGAQWRILPPGGTPSRQNALFFDQQLQSPVMLSLGSALSETRWFDGVAWRQLQTSTAPANRFGAGVAYDSVRGRAVLFGGLFNGLFGDLWEWDGASWQQQQPAVSPPARCRHAMGFDPIRGETVLFGGAGANSAGVLVPLLDTWEWNGVRWLLRQPQTVPSARQWAIMTFDARRRLMAMSGGQPPANPQPLSMMEWDGTDWQQRTHSTPPSMVEAMVFDEARGEVVSLVREYDHDSRSTWTYAPVFPASAASFGTNCAGSAGPVSLTLAGDALPWAGDTMVAEVAPAQGPTLLWYAGSRTSWGAFVLPLALDPYGMPSCTMLVGVETLLGAMAVGGVARFPLAVPSTPALMGLEVFVQAATSDPAANPTGFVPTAGLSLRVGSR